MRLAIALIVLLTTLPSATSKAIADNNDDSKLLFSKDHQERWIIIRNLIFYSETTDNQIVLNQHHGGVMYKTKDQCTSVLLDIFAETSPKNTPVHSYCLLSLQTSIHQSDQLYPLDTLQPPDGL